MKKGFTLVELLAVIVILAVIVLIATPTVLNMIEDAREGSAIQSINGILDAADNYIMSKSLKQEEVKESIDLAKSDLKYKGTTLDEGTLLIDSNGNMSVIAKIGKYCIEKKFNEDEPHIIEGECTFKESQIMKYDGYIATNKSGNDCVTNSSKTCTSAQIKTGLKVAVNVNDKETYDFYVSKENNDGTINLFMDGIIGNSAWATIDDYNNASSTDCDNADGCNMYGPVTALAVLKEKTDNWTNIEKRTDKYNYTSTTIDLNDYRTKLLSRDEAQSFIGCGWIQSGGGNVDSCPSWLRKNTKYFWLLDAAAVNESWANHYRTGLAVWNGSINSINTSTPGNIIPVITISKSMIK